MPLSRRKSRREENQGYRRQARGDRGLCLDEGRRRRYAIVRLIGPSGPAILVGRPKACRLEKQAKQAKFERTVVCPRGRR
jgi:hypothetical protein